VVTGVPPAGATVESGASLLRVQARERLALADGRSLTPWAIAICEALAAALGATHPTAEQRDTAGAQGSAVAGG
jgi:hypothetical protein